PCRPAVANCHRATPKARCAIVAAANRDGVCPRSLQDLQLVLGAAWAPEQKDSGREVTIPEALERSAMRKIYWRLLPFAVITYLLCYIDRINVSFAALTMRGDLGMSAQAFGFAAGTFYWGYFIAEVHSNVILEKGGARLWIGRIMITWVLLSGATAYVGEISSFLKGVSFLAPVADHIDPTSTFAAVRCLLGLAEAGFFPGLILYFTYWFPSYHHGRIVSGFLTVLPIAVAAGATVSTALLGLEWWVGPQVRQVLYLADAVPAGVPGCDSPARL